MGIVYALYSSMVQQKDGKPPPPHSFEGMFWRARYSLNKSNHVSCMPPITLSFYFILLFLSSPADDSTLSYLWGEHSQMVPGGDHYRKGAYRMQTA